MKKINFLIAGSFFFAIQCFAQSGTSSNTDYGGLVQDGIGAGYGGDVPTFNSSAYDNTGFGTNALGLSTWTLGPGEWGNTAVGTFALYSISTYTTYTADGNTAVGDKAMYSLEDGFQNAATGVSALYSSTNGYNNCAYGYNSILSDVLGAENCAYGVGSLAYNTGGSDNIAIGFQSQNGNGINYSASNNTSVGHQTLFQLTTGTNNVCSGYQALYYNTTGNNNTGNGYQALYFNVKGCSNSANGYQALYKNVADWNTAVGDSALFTNGTGKNNTSTGGQSLLKNSSGSSSTADGYQALYNNTASFNTAVGDSALYKNTTGSYNTALGYIANVATSALSNASAIGYNAIAATTNQMELGNNNVSVTMGLSNIAITNVTRLELNTQNGTTPFTVNWLSTPPTYVNGGSGKGWSGLRFDDLKSKSTPGKNPGPGYLSLDTAGNVIYVDTSKVSGSSIGTCASPTILTAANGAIDMNNYNFYFTGNNSRSLNENDVLIGYNCGTTPIPGKLSVLQNSGATLTAAQASIGIYVENDDINTGVAGTPTAVIGLKSYIPTPTNPCLTNYNVAGWFEAVTPLCATAQVQDAIFVPGDTNFPTGGIVAFGFPFSTFVPGDYQLYVNGTSDIGGTIIPSDSTIKKNITPFTYGIKAIRNLNPVSYNYNGVGGFNTTNRYIGLLAQNLQRNVPEGVKSSLIKKDAIKNDTATILNIYEEAVMYTAINAIKQLDSTVTSNKHTDSIAQNKQQQTIDSLRAALQSMQTCLNQICAATSNASSGSNSTISNEQDVTISSTNAPLLYQNIPNPFSTGTKINYYLPQGTQGATIVFYDTYGNQIKQVQLSQTGNGTLNITPDNLSNGIYSYSLVVNGNVIDTKRMVLQK